MRTWITIAVIALAVTIGATAYAYLKPNPHAGDTSKLGVTFTAVEKQRLDAVAITPIELAAATCEEGARCYVAVNDVVYDVSGYPRWARQGRHHGVTAGTDATDAFVGAGHTGPFLEKLPVVGRLGQHP